MLNNVYCLPFYSLDMAKIYELGMSPVEKNPYKALEYYERALQVASLPGEKRQIYESKLYIMLYIYYNQYHIELNIV